MLTASQSDLDAFGRLGNTKQHKAIQSSTSNKQRVSFDFGVSDGDIRLMTRTDKAYPVVNGTLPAPGAVQELLLHPGRQTPAAAIWKNSQYPSGLVLTGTRFIAFFCFVGAGRLKTKRTSETKLTAVQPAQPRCGAGRTW